MQSENAAARTGNRKDRRKIFLGILLVLIVIVLSIQFSGGGGTKTNSASTKAPAKSDKKDNPLTSSDPDVMVAELNKHKQPDAGGTRNLFQYYMPPPPVPPPPTPEQIAEQKRNQPPPAVCGNHSCEAGETYDNCPTDCPP